MRRNVYFIEFCVKFISCTLKFYSYLLIFKIHFILVHLTDLFLSNFFLDFIFVEFLQLPAFQKCVIYTRFILQGIKLRNRTSKWNNPADRWNIPAFWWNISAGFLSNWNISAGQSLFFTFFFCSINIYKYILIFLHEV